MATHTQSRRAASPDQLEFSFAPQVHVSMRVDRLADGRVLLTPAANVEVWINTQEAADRLGRSRRWVQTALETGLLHGERIGRNWRVDAVYLEEYRTLRRNWRD